MKTRTKRMISLVLVAITLCIVTCSVSVSAAMNDYCIQHGPWETCCAGHAETREQSHTFTYKGYPKVCEYTYVLYNTHSICSFCKYETYDHGPHSHGYRGHSTGTDGCGWSNDSSCRIGGSQCAEHDPNR